MNFDTYYDSGDIAREWDKRLYKMQFTAERAALKNIRKGIMPPDCASEANGNIWYDAIGGQMKADIWGLIAPNCPEIAARYAEIDGKVAHQGVGVEGEIFVAGRFSQPAGKWVACPPQCWDYRSEPVVRRKRSNRPFRPHGLSWRDDGARHGLQLREYRRHHGRHPGGERNSPGLERSTQGYISHLRQRIRTLEDLGAGPQNLPGWEKSHSTCGTTLAAPLFT